jgi:hypothetical protein
LSFDNYQKYDWSHPSEVLYLPISGYVARESAGSASQNGIALIYAGCEGVYWTAETGSLDGSSKSIRLKVTGDTHEKELFAWEEEFRYYGCQIRCVRDDSVKD